MAHKVLEKSSLSFSAHAAAAVDGGGVVDVGGKRGAEGVLCFEASHHRLVQFAHKCRVDGSLRTCSNAGKKEKYWRTNKHGKTFSTNLR
jgi:hypothetical protein